jgi:hypothetical protein
MCHGQDNGEASHAAGVGRGSAGQCWAGDGQLLYETVPFYTPDARHRPRVQGHRGADTRVTVGSRGNSGRLASDEIPGVSHLLAGHRVFAFRLAPACGSVRCGISARAGADDQSLALGRSDHERDSRGLRLATRLVCDPPVSDAAGVYADAGRLRTLLAGECWPTRRHATPDVAMMCDRTSRCGHRSSEREPT